MTWDEFKQYAEPTDAPDDGVTHDMAPHEVRALIEKAVREEREAERKAVVNYLRAEMMRTESPIYICDLPRIGRGEHRK